MNKEEVLKMLIDKYGVDHPRYQHILGVANMAYSLAKEKGIDPEKAYLAGLLHDYYRHDDKEYLKTIIEPEIVKKFENSPIMYHAYAIANNLKKVFNIDDEEIYLAVRNHVHGRKNMTVLEEVMLISDYTEVNRSNPGSIYVREILKRDYDLALYLTFDVPYNYLIANRGVIMSKEQIEVKDYYHYRFVLNHFIKYLNNYNKDNNFKESILSEISNFENIIDNHSDTEFSKIEYLENKYVVKINYIILLLKECFKFNKEDIIKEYYITNDFYDKVTSDEYKGIFSNSYILENIKELLNKINC